MANATSTLTPRRSSWLSEIHVDLADKTRAARGGVRLVCGLYPATPGSACAGKSAQSGVRLLSAHAVCRAFARGRQVEIAEALFPRYLFVYLEVGRSNWSTIRSTRGVVRLVEFGGVTTRIPSSLIEALAEQPVQQKKLFEVGERLRVIDGPFVGIETVLQRLYKTPDGEARVIVLMDILARPQQISLPVCVVRRAA